MQLRIKYLWKLYGEMIESILYTSTLELSLLIVKFYTTPKYILFDMIDFTLNPLKILFSKIGYGHVSCKKYLDKFIKEYEEYIEYKEECWKTFLQIDKNKISKDVLSIVKIYYYT